LGKLGENGRNGIKSPPKLRDLGGRGFSPPSPPILGGTGRSGIKRPPKLGDLGGRGFRGQRI